MPLTINIDSESVKLELPEATIENYKFDYAEGDNYSKGYPETIRLYLSIDVMKLLSLDSSPNDSISLVQQLRNWCEYEYTHEDSYKEYYRKVTLKNYFDDEEIRTIVLSHAYVNKSTESLDPLQVKHSITLELWQKGDGLDYGGS